MLDENLEMLSTFWLNLLKNKIAVQDVIDCLKEWATVGSQLFKAPVLNQYLIQNFFNNSECDEFEDVVELFSNMLEKCQDRGALTSKNIVLAVKVSLLPLKFEHKSPHSESHYCIFREFS